MSFHVNAVFLSGVLLIQKSVACGLTGSPAPAFLRDTRATASWTNTDRCAPSSPSPPASATNEHGQLGNKTQCLLTGLLIIRLNWPPLKYYCIICNICKVANFVNKFNNEPFVDNAPRLHFGQMFHKHKWKNKLWKVLPSAKWHAVLLQRIDVTSEK